MNVVIFWQLLLRGGGMSLLLAATDYSRPVQVIFAQSRSGAIHSVFHRAANIVFDDTMLVLLSAELPRMPNSIRLPSSTMSALRDTLRPGMPTVIEDGRLLILGSNCSLSLPDAPAWEPRPEVERCQWRREIVAQHTRSLAHYLAERRPQDGLAELVRPLLLGLPMQETPLLRMALPALRMLMRASWRQDRAGVEEAARRLAGLGPGLTPSGDDALGGFAAVMALLSPYLSVDGMPRAHLATIIADVARSRTTLLSATLLQYAAHGEVAEHVGELLLALALPAEASEVVVRASDHLLAFGASSGGDTLLGVLLGLRTLKGGSDDDVYGE
jgi:hypothetical protein